MIQNPDCLGASGMCSLVLDSRRLRSKAAPVPLPGMRVGSALYSNMYGASGVSDVASEGCISENRIMSTSNCTHAAMAWNHLQQLISPLVCVRPPMPQLWRATRSLLLCGMGSVHLLFVDVLLGVGVLDLCCKKLVSRLCILDASPGAVASGFRASSAAACIGSRKPTH